MYQAALWIVTVICVIATALPAVPLAHGAFRSFDFARLQVISLSGFTLAAAVAHTLTGTALPVMIVLLVSCVFVQARHIIRFSPLWKKQSATFRGDVSKAATLDLLVCNVKQGNHRFEEVVTLLRERDPDVVVLIETNQRWIDAVRDELSAYPERLECPDDKSYGLFMASKFPFSRHEVRHLLNPEVPSFDCTLALPDGKSVRLFAVHPEPPVPVRDTIGRDAEILTIGEMAREETLPVIVTGDLNDVAWSDTTRRFLRISRLLDPRQGRGMFNTFDARFWFLRWPLDHVFHSEDFEVIRIERLRFVGSDHFPMYYAFALVDRNHNELPPQATESDIEEAEQARAIEENRDRHPVGTDWERC